MVDYLSLFWAIHSHVYPLRSAAALGETSDVGFEVLVIVYATFVPFVESELLIANTAHFPFDVLILAYDSQVMGLTKSTSKIVPISHCD